MSASLTHARKMVLVPEALLNSLQEKQREQIAPVTNSLVRLRGEMNQVLGDQTDDVNDDEKAKAYSQSLQRYLAYKEKQSDNPLAVKLVRQTDSDPAEGVDFSGIEQEVIQSAPASMRGKAKLLMKKLKANSDVLNWNERGEVAFGDQPPLKGSNLWTCHSMCYASENNLINRWVGRNSLNLWQVSIYPDTILVTRRGDELCNP